jgi:pimeloyl-ACP methyl ester carboxylesterase
MQWALWAVLAGLMGSTAAPAQETVVLEVSPRVRATAEWSAPQPGKLSVLLVHGFLQTRASSIIYRVSDHLRSLGYGVLAPTLSLGIDMRAQSLDCAAIHTHSMEGDLQEIGLWVEWLGARSPEGIVLMGHSSGATQIAAYLAGPVPPAAAQAILLSPVFFGAGSKGLESPAHAARAQALLGHDDPSIIDFALSYCERYPAPPGAYLSYLAWGRDRVTSTLAMVDLPVVAVFGDNDDTLPHDWPQAIEASGAETIIVAGGDHFFRDFAEFELYAAISGLLGGARSDASE